MLGLNYLNGFHWLPSNWVLNQYNNDIYFQSGYSQSTGNSHFNVNRLYKTPIFRIIFLSEFLPGKGNIVKVECFTFIEYHNIGTRLRWTLSLLSFWSRLFHHWIWTCLLLQKWYQSKIANSVDPDEMAHYEPSHLDLHCLQRYPFLSAWLKWLTLKCVIPGKGNSVVGFHWIQTNQSQAPK